MSVPDLLTRRDLITLKPYNDTPYGTYAAAVERDEIKTVPDPRRPKSWRLYVRTSADEYRATRAKPTGHLWRPEMIFEKHPALDHQILNNWRKKGAMQWAMDEINARPDTNPKLKAFASPDPGRKGYWLYSITVVEHLLRQYRLEKPSDEYDEEIEVAGKKIVRRMVWLKLLDREPLKSKYHLSTSEVYGWEKDPRGCPFVPVFDEKGKEILGRGQKPGIVSIKFLGDYGSQRDYIPREFLEMVAAFDQDGKILDDTQGFESREDALKLFSEDLLRKFEASGDVETRPVRIVRLSKRADGTFHKRIECQKWYRAKHLKGIHEETTKERPDLVTSAEAVRMGVEKHDLNYNKPQRQGDCRVSLKKHVRTDGRPLDVQRLRSRTSRGKQSRLDYFNKEQVALLLDKAPRKGANGTLSQRRIHIDPDKSRWWPGAETQDIAGITSLELKDYRNKTNPKWGGLTIHGKRIPLRLWGSSRDQHWYYSEADAINVREFKKTGRLPATMPPPPSSHKIAQGLHQPERPKSTGRGRPAGKGPSKKVIKKHQRIWREYADRAGDEHSWALGRDKTVGRGKSKKALKAAREFFRTYPDLKP
jgi:hypothetical protein